MYFGTGSWHIVATVARTKEICYTGHLREPSAEGDPRSDMLFLRCCAVQKYYFETLASTQYPKNHCVWACHYGDRSEKQHVVLAGFQNSTFVPRNSVFPRL